MTVPAPLFSIAGFDVYAYSLCLAVGAALGLTLMVLVARMVSERVETVLRLGLWVIPMGIVGARLAYCLIQAPFLFAEYGVAIISKLSWGGFALVGAVLGAAGAAWICSALYKKSFAMLLDLLATAGMLTLACARFGEAFTLEGVGREVLQPMLMRFPFAMPNAYYVEEYHVAVFFWEGIAAMIITIVGIVVLFKFKKNATRPGDAAAVVGLLFSVSQIFLESLREDSFLRFGFVRVNQLLGVAVIAAAVVYWARDSLAEGGSHKNVIIITVIQALGVGLLVGIEFALDKSTIPNILLYIIMVLTLVGMCVSALRLRKGSARRLHVNNDMIINQ
ncbi:hypothetical protein AGMMS49992_10610 [Clostridia bacterium]|nr:hypothetical protein AGMMS49992_10610 [Clostridia bacterium]